MKAEPVTSTCKFCKSWDGLHCLMAADDASPMFAVNQRLEAVQIVTLADFGCNRFEERA
jgi:hypothetical protein